MKRLVLCRHAKSSWKDSSLADIDRPLNGRGKRNAPEMGRRLLARGIKPDLIVSSPARRAYATAAYLAEELGVPEREIRVVEAIYDAYPMKLLEIIRTIDAGHDQVLMVGHNPETTILANLLGRLRLENVPTCGIVALDFGVRSWEEIEEARGALVFFDSPRR
ncbi:MAG TPA: histidine phosphatase family protein [Desulfobacteraceae bacterium]|nr:histidine phosphatase family protein [Desulfobacteraceae bacterium]